MPHDIRDHWIEDWEKQAIIRFYQEYPLLPVQHLRRLQPVRFALGDPGIDENHGRGGDPTARQREIPSCETSDHFGQGMRNGLFLSLWSIIIPSGSILRFNILPRWTNAMVGRRKSLRFGMPVCRRPGKGDGKTG